MAQGTQYPIMIYIGKESKKQWIYVSISVSVQLLSCVRPFGPHKP